MSTNIIKINNTDFLQWELSDELTQELVSWLNENGQVHKLTNIFTVTSGTFNNIVSNANASLTTTGDASISGDLVVKGTIYCDTLKAAADVILR